LLGGDTNIGPTTIAGIQAPIVTAIWIAENGGNERMKPRTEPAAGRRRSCFSLIEILIVVVIIGMILGLVGPNVVKKLKKAQTGTAKSQVLLLANACKDYYLDMSEYPSKLENLIQNPGTQKWDGPYLDPPKLPLDPWGEPYHYDVPGQHSAFDIYSYGTDKAPGGEGDAADANSWD